MERDLSCGELYSLLPRVSAGKRDRIGRFRRFEDKQRALFGELLVRMEISRSLSIPNGDIEILTGERGKPHLDGHPDFHFNISHAGRYIACAFSGEPVGIDIEVIAQADMKIADRFFAKGEREYIFTRTSESARREAFYRVWTMKEAYIKREGSGLGIPLPSFDVFDAGGACFREILRNGEAICNCCTDEPGELVKARFGCDDILRWYSAGRMAQPVKRLPERSAW
jgi:4'-phosphopantetheinyl transferase